MEGAKILVDLPEGKIKASEAIPAVPQNSSACPILPESQPWMLLKKIGKYVEEFGDQVVALFLPVFSSPMPSPMRLNISDAT